SRSTSTKCIGCETCEHVCLDNAIKITNKRLSSPMWQRGSWLDREDRRPCYRAGRNHLPRRPQASQQVRPGQGQDMDRHVVRFLLRYEDSRSPSTMKTDQPH